jgi:hypothetical protein
VALDEGCVCDAAEDIGLEQALEVSSDKRSLAACILEIKYYVIVGG